MTTISNRRSSYESQTSEAAARRNDKNVYDYGTCEKCGKPTVAVNGKWLDCSFCELQAKKEAAAFAAQEKLALQIVLDVANVKKHDPRIARRESILAAFREEPLSKSEVNELYAELAEIDQALQFHPSDTCQSYIGAAWDKIEEVNF